MMHAEGCHLEPVSKLKNIGATLSARLTQIGIFTRGDLLEMGPVGAYHRMNEIAGKKLPVCYNLYSLEAALRNIDWRQITEEEKQNLKKAAAA